MEILIALLLVALVAAAITIPKKPKKSDTEFSTPSLRELSDIYVLLQNVERYDGSPKGQKKLGGDI